MSNQPIESQGSAPEHTSDTENSRGLASFALRKVGDHVFEETLVDTAISTTREFIHTTNEIARAEQISKAEWQSLIYLLGIADRPKDPRLRTQFRVDFGRFLHVEHDYLKNADIAAMPGAHEYTFLFTSGRNLTGNDLNGDRKRYDFEAIVREYALAKRKITPKRRTFRRQPGTKPVSASPGQSELLVARTELRAGATKFLRARYDVES